MTDKLANQVFWDAVLVSTVIVGLDNDRWKPWIRILTLVCALIIGLKYV